MANLTGKFEISLSQPLRLLLLHSRVGHYGQPRNTARASNKAPMELLQQHVAGFSICDWPADIQMLCYACSKELGSPVIWLEPGMPYADQVFCVGSKEKCAHNHSPYLQFLSPADKMTLSPRVGRGAGVLGARGAKKRRPWLGRGALQNFGGAEIPKKPFN